MNKYDSESNKYSCDRLNSTTFFYLSFWINQESEKYRSIFYDRSLAIYIKTALIIFQIVDLSYTHRNHHYYFT